ncbi:agmatinase [Pelagicoccus albus]|uniref:Agmatinase n=1 Tax=Pelagicoccus albus TaxID=415222 RepID=A0A7X1B906_9BACT|nr:agmatinase [Pelagicoccus albus]MBC2607772.1 agmatinase [Pelagicoccus albus]
MGNNSYQNPPAFHSDDIEPSAPEKATFHIIPVPWETSVSYGGGTADGPNAILHSSVQLEHYLDGSFPGDAGIYTADAVDCQGEATEVLARIQAATSKSLELGKCPILLGGEHAMTLGPVKACLEQGIPFGIVQFDAHADLRYAYQGNLYSHASVMERCTDLGVPLHQIGVRALCKEEADRRSERGVTFLDAADLYWKGYPEQLLPDDFPEHVFITFDVDGLDPSIMPSTGTPVPGGLNWYQAIDGLERALKGRKLIGADFVELAPQPGQHAPDFLVANLIYKFMEIAQRQGCL